MNKVEAEDKKISPNKITIGSFWKEANESIFIMSACDVDKVQLISLQDGSRWNNPTTVKSFSDINHDEWARIGGGGTFTRITTPIKITPESA